MCGIVGYIGKGNAVDFLLPALARLEYRGYDSAGIAVIKNKRLLVHRVVGRISQLWSSIPKPMQGAKVGIAHTRWATHGVPAVRNAHPITDAKKEFAVVHNGIIENFAELKASLKKKGVVFSSDTDTEVLVQLIAQNYAGNLLNAVLKTLKQIRGAYAFAVVSIKEPDKIIAVKKGSPLIVGVGEGFNMLASDIPAVLEYTRNVLVLEDNQVAVVTQDAVELLSVEGKKLKPRVTRVDQSLEVAEKEGYPHFMLKEIFEQPKAVHETMVGLRSVFGDPFKKHKKPLNLQKFSKVVFTACGTSYHAALVGKIWFQKLVGKPIEVVYAPELKASGYPIDKNTLVLGISQSGETIDTKFALEYAKSKGATIAGLVNIVNSSIDRLADIKLHTHAGLEIGVAATKTYLAQLVALLTLALLEAPNSRSLGANFAEDYVKLPELIESTLQNAKTYRKVAKRFSQYKNMLFLGRGLGYPTALEGALKLKEISYIHAEGYPAGEMKHGPIALVDRYTPVITVSPKDDLFEKMLSNIQEVKARGADVVAVTSADGVGYLRGLVNYYLEVPKANSLLYPLLTVVPLQLFAYYIADSLGRDVDKPRNLAKTVTVE